MGDVRVVGASLSGGRIERLRVQLHGLPERTIDRAQAVRWMQDGHSLIPVVAGARLSALQLVEAGDELVVRTDNAPEPSDRLPELAPLPEPQA